jgi:hypothetical protein
MAAALIPDEFMEPNRIFSPMSNVQATRWAALPLRQKMPVGHYFRASKRCSLANATQRVGVRFRHDLLAATTRLATGRNLGFDPFRTIAAQNLASGFAAVDAAGVERTFAWLNQFRRLRVRYEKTS